MVDKILERILASVTDYYKARKKELPTEAVPVSGKVYDEEELKNLIKASLEGWWTEGEWNSLFEKKLGEYVGMPHVLTTNSGSSANLIAVKSLNSVVLGKRRIMRGDEVITLAMGFPTTVNPIIEAGAVPVFIDVELGNYNADISMLQEALSDKTKAVVFAHMLGNPFKAREVREFCDEEGLWLVEDNCDALGAEYDGQKTGSFGDFSTCSFYPAHHITTAEGGAVMTKNPILHKIARSIRDWGRDCWCPTGRDNTCGKRFSWKLGQLPEGFDHKYIYSEIGYNLKMTDLQAALGVAQMGKLVGFVKMRRENFSYLYSILQEFGDYLQLPKATEGSKPSWFGFPILIKDRKTDRRTFMEFLNRKGVATRQLFGGNLLRQPYFINYDIKHRKVSALANSDTVMRDAFWIGIYPALEKRHFDYVRDRFREFFKNKGP
jgi:CDP-6-deoxy-D-xylo-4-hexulose-3-dehydrase